MVYFSVLDDLKKADSSVVRVINDNGDLLNLSTNQRIGFELWQNDEVLNAKSQGVYEENGALVFVSEPDKKIGLCVYLADVTSNDITIDASAVLAAELNDVFVKIAEDVYSSLLPRQVTGMKFFKLDQK